MLNARNWPEELTSREQLNSRCSVELLRSLLDYNPETGILTWKVHMSTRARAGMEAGILQDDKKYRRVGIRGKYYMAHRVAWAIVTGEWPEQEIDHKNGKRDDNRLSNLRSVTPAQNKRNAIHKNNTGYVGASYHAISGKYRAQIRHNGKRIFLGWFKSAIEASNAYIKASKMYHGEYSRC